MNSLTLIVFFSFALHLLLHFLPFFRGLAWTERSLSRYLMRCKWNDKPRDSCKQITTTILQEVFYRDQSSRRTVAPISASILNLRRHVQCLLVLSFVRSSSPGLFRPIIIEIVPVNQATASEPVARSLFSTLVRATAHRAVVARVITLDSVRNSFVSPNRLQEMTESGIDSLNLISLVETVFFFFLLTESFISQIN